MTVLVLNNDNNDDKGDNDDSGDDCRDDNIWNDDTADNSGRTHSDNRQKNAWHQ